MFWADMIHTAPRKAAPKLSQAAGETHFLIRQATAKPIRHSCRVHGQEMLSEVVIGRPTTRPWQHVLEPLSGYLLLGQKLLEGRNEFAEAWNFGPSEEENVSVGEIVHLVKMVWPKIDYEISQTPNQPHEASLLRLDCSKARTKLKWVPVWAGNEAIEKTTLWYKAFYESSKVSSLEQLNLYIAEAHNNHIAWANK